jgi:two-component system nitrate/nitrite response regulator NarL
MTMTRVAAIDDDRMLVEGLMSWLADEPGLHIVATATTVDELLATRCTADVVLLDLLLQDGSSPAANVRRLVEAGHRVLVISVWSDPAQVTATLSAGAHGYLTKDHDLASLADAVRSVAAGETVYSPELALAFLADTGPDRPHLSPQERAVLVAYASGMTLRAAARYIGVSPETAKTYLERVKGKYQELGRPTYTKLDLANRVREDNLA